MSAFSIKNPGLVRQESWVGNLLYVGDFVYCEQQEGGNGYLLFGGMLLGDTFHTIPLLNWMTGERRRSKIVWWSGTYERPAVEFLKNFYPIEARYCRDGVPAEREDRLIFIKHYFPLLNKVLKKLAWETVRFDSKVNKEFDLKNIDKLKAEPGNFIVIHPASRHSWKNIPAISSLDWRQFGLPLITVGGAGEPLIPGSLDLRGRDFLEVARALAGARLIVAIHSSISCLSLYLHRPTLVCAPADDPGYVRFGALKPQMVDLVQPSERELQEAVCRGLEESKWVCASSAQAGEPAPPDNNGQPLKAGQAAGWWMSLGTGKY